MKEKFTLSKSPGKHPDENAMSKVFITGHIIEVETMDKHPRNLTRYRKFDKGHYIDLDTGELCDYHLPKQSSRQSSMLPSFERLRRIINANFFGLPSECHVILTYREQITNPQPLYTDFKKFWQKLSYRYPHCEYIAVTEPQHRGSWHFHVLIKDMQARRLFIPHEELTRLWGHGFTWISSLAGNDNIGLYFMVRLKDVDLHEDLQNGRQSKRILKGARLQFYPPHMKLYRCSSGIVRPTTVTMPYREVQRLVKSQPPCFSRTIRIIQNDDGGETELNAITYEHYNLKR